MGASSLSFENLCPAETELSHASPLGYLYSMRTYRNIIFDVGSVLVNWMRINLYTTLLHGDRDKAKWMVDNIVTNSWNDQTDLGKPIKECIFELKQAYLKYAPYIVAYWYCYKDMDGGEIPGIYEVMKDLKDRGYQLYCLTNWSHETFPIVKKVHARLFELFDGIVVSGEEKMVKPNPEIYNLLLGRYNLNASESVFIDDRQRNVDGANQVGIQGILFTGSNNLKEQLFQLSIL